MTRPRWRRQSACRSPSRSRSPIWPRAGARPAAFCRPLRQSRGRWCCHDRSGSAAMAEVSPPLIGLAEHPRAAWAIRRTKAIASVAGFLAAGVGSAVHGVPLADAALRGLGGAVVGYLAGWFAAIVIWRSMLEAEARLVVQQAVERRRRERERAAKAE